jgi:hypothetical protein
VEPNRRVDGQRLDVILAQIARTTTDPATRAQVEGFEALLRARYNDLRRPAFHSVREEMTDFIMPRIGNPDIWNSSRFMDLLGHVVTQIVPSLGESDEITGIAIAIIEEEMERHRDLQDRIHQAVGA